MSPVLVLGIDGVRHDALCAASTPALDRLAATGYRVPVPVSADSPTISGPCWTTIATGLSAPVHGVWDNVTPGHPVRPDFLSRIRAARPGAVTFAAAGWAPLVRPVGCGPIFAGPGLLPLADDERYDVAAADRADEAIVAGTVAALATEAPVAAFVHLGTPDLVAHRDGVGAGYRQAIETADRRAGRILAAVRDRAAATGEDWTVLATTDHGHRDGGGHGGDSVAERAAWLIAAGPGVPRQPPTVPTQAGICTLVLAAAGVGSDDAEASA
ncbi:alkaline phosphatase family protein [Actinocatenispora comari]|uniref:AP endonuclease n=1 Tax=Actinocatenispora comari TaxID=2807577 RepID=A0A8J4AFQ4_9ACTN|nr:alkaline phosphatase family protein [Actinocatenispora comari]GIL30268.1 AP endonuclease [Actinocatenispora comari]